jgi:predicted kinase
LEEAKYHIIIDDTNFNPIHEERIRMLIDIHNEITSGNVKYEMEVVIINTPLEECIERDKKRENSV